MEKRLFVGNLPFTMTSDDLRALFTTFGEIVSAEIVINKISNRSKGFGFVEFAQSSEAQAAIDALNETEQGGRKIIVSFARPKVESSFTQPSNSSPASEPESASDSTTLTEEDAMPPDDTASVITDEPASSEEPNPENTVEVEPDQIENPVSSEDTHPEENS